jgi:chromosome segregation ATPase
MADTISTANSELRRAQAAIQAARAARPPRGQAASLRATTGELDAAVSDVERELDSLSELGETESLRLQMAMDRLSKLMSTLSNLLKKASDTSGQITQNLK